MEIQVRGNGISVDNDLLTYVNRRATRLDRLIDRVIDAKLELRHLKQRSEPDSVSAQITIRSGRDVLRAEEQAVEATVAIDQAFAKLERRVERIHAKRRRRKGPGQPTIRGTHEDILIAEPDDSTDIDDDEVGKLVRTKRFGVKPMDVDEAIEQMELLGHDFFLFHYSDEDIPSVVYRRRDGAYGLLIPRDA
jgi:putative sigma-54 modulation protein